MGKAQTSIVDFVNGGDTGQDNLSSIQPFSNGEGVTQTTMRRSPENLRSRTEILRQDLEDLKYYRDYGHQLIIEYTGSNGVTWGGATGDAGTGIIAGNGTLKISPILAPDSAKRFTLATGTNAVNRITYAGSTSSYASQGLNGITIEHRDGGAATTLSAAISDGPIKRILVVFDSANAAHTPAAVKSLVDAAVAGDSALAGLITTTVSGTGIISVVAETYMEGSADDESHWITVSDLVTLTTGSPLTYGQGIAIWYKYRVEPTAGDGTDPKAGLAGGRAESSVTRNTQAIPAGSLFLTSASPAKIPGAVPLCRVGYQGQLIFFDGTRLAKDEMTKFLGLTAAISTLKAELAAGDGDLVGINTSFTPAPVSYTGDGGIGVSIVNLENALDAIDVGLVRRRAFTAVFTDNFATTGGDYNSAAAFDVLNTTFTQGGIFLARAGDYTLSDAIGQITSNPTVYAERSTVRLNLPAAETSSFNITGIWHGVELNSTTTQGYFNVISSDTFRVYDCEMMAGALELSGQFSFENVRFRDSTSTRIYGVRILETSSADPPRGNFKNCVFEPVNAGSGANASAVRILSLSEISSTTGKAAITFDNCEFIGTQGASVPIPALSLSDVKAPVHFRNCIFRNTSTTFSGHLVRITSNSKHIVFDNCTFVSATGQVLDNYGGGVVFNNCRFIGGSNTAGITDPQLVRGGSFYREQPTRFIDCSFEPGTANITTGTTGTQPWAIFGGEGSGNTSSAGFYYLKGCTFKIPGAELHRCTNIVFLSPPTTAVGGDVNVIEDCVFDCNQAQWTASLGTYTGPQSGAVSYLVHFGGSATNGEELYDIVVNNFHIIKYQGPSADVAGGLIYCEYTKAKNLQVGLYTAGGTYSTHTLSLFQFTSSYIDGLYVTGNLGSTACIECSASYHIQISAHGNNPGHLRDARITFENGVAPSTAYVAVFSRCNLLNSNFTCAASGTVRPMVTVRGSRILLQGNTLTRVTTATTVALINSSFAGEQVIVANNNALGTFTSAQSAVDFSTTVSANHNVVGNIFSSTNANAPTLALTTSPSGNILMASATP